MNFLLWIVALGAGAAAFLNWKKVNRIVDKVEEAERQARFNKSTIDDLEKHLAAQLNVVRGFMAKLAAGEKVRREAILEGRLYQDLKAEECQRILEEHPDTPVVDVRTAGEYASGHIPGAVLIPVDDLPKRMAEISRSAELVIVHCAAGGRSAAACEYLSQQGYLNLANMIGGMGAWKGPRESGAPLAKK